MCKAPLELEAFHPSHTTPVVHVSHHPRQGDLQQWLCLRRNIGYATPEKIVLILSKLVFTGSKYSKNALFIFDDTITDLQQERDSPAGGGLKLAIHFSKSNDTFLGYFDPMMMIIF